MSNQNGATEERNPKYPQANFKYKMLSKSKSPNNRLAKLKLESVKTEPEDAESIEQLLGRDQNLSYQNHIHYKEPEHNQGSLKQNQTLIERGSRYMVPEQVIFEKRASLEDSYTQTKPTVRNSPYCENLEKKFSEVNLHEKVDTAKIREILNQEEPRESARGLKDIQSMHDEMTRLKLRAAKLASHSKKAPESS